MTWRPPWRITSSVTGPWVKSRPMPDESTFDYVIAGAGAAGCILAYRLAAEDGASVLLLEAGPSDNSWKVRMPRASREAYKEGSPFATWYRSEPQPNVDGRVLPDLVCASSSRKRSKPNGR